MNALDSLCTWFDTLSPQTLGELDRHYAARARFKDPFHEVEGVAAIYAILDHTFKKLPGARFRVTEKFPREPHAAMIVWEMDFVMPMSHEPTTIRGATHLEFDQQGLVTLHRDYWDAAEELYARLPVLKWLMRALARQAAAKIPHTSQA